MRIIRYRILTIVVVGAVMSALSLLALWRVLSLTTEGRIERARDGLVTELELLARTSPALGKEALATTPQSSLIGMRGGFWDGQHSESALYGLPQEWRSAVMSTLTQAKERQALTVLERRQGQSTLLVAARPGQGPLLAWASVKVLPSIHHRFWLTVVIVLALATAILFTSAVGASVSFLRSANDLHRCLVQLGEDLSTPVPRLRIRELSEVGDGIAQLAQSLRQAREEQSRMAQKLAQKDRLVALGRVVAGVAHEVRNPLASIKLRLDLAAVAEPLPPLAASAISHSAAEIARLDRLVADLLLVAGRHLGPRKLTSLTQLVKARAETLSPWAAQRDVRFVIRASADCSTVLDPESVARAIDNLLRNAVEASPSGHSVHIHVRQDRELVWVRVEDEGDGVPRPSELFEPFFTTKPEGTGLGLPISRSIARAHGGDVSYARVPAADTAADDGTTSSDATVAMTPAQGKPSERTRFELSLPKTLAEPAKESE